MNTRLLMAASALVQGLAGIGLLFLPNEIATALGAGEAALGLQGAGSAWFAFAILDWTARGGTLGGIYGRPVVLGNLTLFLTNALVLLKAASAADSSAVLAGGIVCGLFALAFGRLLFRHPGPPRAG